MTERHSPLDAIHRAAGAKMVPFGGWDMPLSYPDGTLAEHRACRSGAVVFDVSHLGTVEVRGSTAKAVLQQTFTNDLDRIEPGRAQYTHLLDDADGSVLDDIIVWWLTEESFHVMPNASNTDRVVSALKTANGGESLTISDITATRALLAIQGPKARALLQDIAPEAAEIGRFRVTGFEWHGEPAIAAGTGYTGEDGVEVALAPEVASAFWNAVTAAGAVPAGLGARDTLRLEAGLPLHGHELGPGITPLQADLGWVVRFDKPDFRGKAALLAERESGVTRRIRGLSVPGRRPPRADQEVRRGDDLVGVITSGNFSPSLEHGIALALVDPDVDVGDSLVIHGRGDSRMDATVVDLPFV